MSNLNNALKSGLCLAILGLGSVACQTSQEEGKLESSDEFLASLDSQEEEPAGFEVDEPASTTDQAVEDFAIEENYESFDPADIRIKFEFDSAALTADNTAALDKIVAGLKKDPLAKIFVRGHADKQGPEDYNEHLSEKRAKVIFDYLTSHGIDEQRLIRVHLGESEPLVDGNNVAAFRKNRRGDFHLDYSDGAFSR
ncbi:OmpA family protein [Pseudobacteriovorax antillogorgiicola]|uniref:Outer membrane protein OmpA n=1 Tax=Pseudobacteriovorax antillogorgiicola TaxID=1513793 RepID=A0A1Y6CP44_9BACT|nr:OmpA family protein [Pseudobacteriovorax antillogorgiicola]TCS44601.1 outer membrane protein OmpA-like peptidoglycan-associated protein [Pseudobacteriovorax antillogorgiicola]SMF78172.1 Outer membrane protein OmpA [Pseudobacteriovorax antillogorgiicola]